MLGKFLTIPKKPGTFITSIFSKANVMQENMPGKLLVTKLTFFSLLRLQDGLAAFEERPSEKYDGLKTKGDEQKVDCRINAEELFFHFTADIIKKQVLFTR